MSWTDNLLDASFRGVSMQVQGSELETTRALVQHGVPYRDGDTVEDLGREARHIELRAVVWGDAYEPQLQALLAALDAPGKGELIHPIYGSVQVYVGRHRVRDDAERPDAAELQITFVEAAPDPTFFTRTFATASDALADQQQLGALAAAMARGEATLSKIRSYGQAVRGVVARVTGIVSSVRNTIDGGWSATLTDVLGMPGISLQVGQLRSLILGAVAGLADLTQGAPPAYDPLPEEGRRRSLMDARNAIEAATPATAAELMGGSAIPRDAPGTDELPALVARAWRDSLTAARQGMAAALTPPPAPLTDAVTRVAFAWVTYLLSEQAMVLCDAITSALDTDLDATALTPAEIEQLANRGRSMLEAAITLHRQSFELDRALTVVEPLRQLADLLQSVARAVILVRPPLIQRGVVTDASVRQLAHRWYGDSERANEILRLNPGLPRPWSVPAGTVLYAYSR